MVYIGRRERVRKRKGAGKGWQRIGKRGDGRR